MDIENLKSQFKILESIQNPPPYILDAIKKTKSDIIVYESKHKEELTINKVIDKIEKLKIEYPNLEINYSVKLKTVKQPTLRSTPTSKKEEISIVTHKSTSKKDYTYKEPKAIIFQNQAYGAIKYWKDVLQKVCNLMREYHPAEIDKIKQIRGPRRIYFTTQLNQLSSPEARLNPRKIKNTNIYIETHWSANRHVVLCYKIIEFFGHNKNDLNILTK